MIYIWFSFLIRALVFSLQKEVGGLLTPPSEKQKADNWMGLETKRELQIKYADVNR